MKRKTRADRRAETEEALEVAEQTRRLRVVHPKAEIKRAPPPRPLAPTKLDVVTGWPRPLWRAGVETMGLFWHVLGEGDTPSETVDNALKRYPQRGLT